MIVSIVYFTGNYSLVISSVVWKRKGSGVPFIAGISGALALALSDLGALKYFWWVPPILDPYGLPMLVFIALEHFRNRKRPYPKGPD